MQKKLPIGIEDFETVIRNNYYYVDKTSFLKPVLTSGGYVQLITRPRRFGKSLFMDTMDRFLSVNPENPGGTSRQERLFAGLGVLEDRAFCRRIRWRFSPENAAFASRGVELKDAALSGDADGMSNVLFEVLADFVSIRDTATRAPAENYYHGLLVGLLACVPRDGIAFFESNREAGNGFADISFTSSRMPRTGVVIELKKADAEDDLEDRAREALEQIRGKRYVQGFRRKRCSRIFGYGIAFHGKTCMVLAEELTPEA